MPLFSKKKTEEKDHKQSQSSTSSSTTIINSNNGTRIETRESTSHVQHMSRTVSMVETTFQRQSIDPIRSSLRSITENNGSRNGFEVSRPSLPSSINLLRSNPRIELDAKVYQPVYTKTSQNLWVPASTSNAASTSSLLTTVNQGNQESGKPSKKAANNNSTPTMLKVKVKKTGKKYDGELRIPTYQTSSKKRGKVLILNNIKFIKDSHERHGAEFDEKNLSSLFEQMDFKIITKRNWNDRELEKTVKEFGSNSNWKTRDVCIVIIMSHGSKQDGYTNILCTNSVLVPTDTIIDLLCAEKCPHLHGIPKIFIFQCCRGDREDMKVEKKSRPVQTDSRPFRMPRNYADMLIAHATVPGYVSYRDPETGSWYIQTLCQVFAENAHEMDVETMLKIIDEKLSEFPTVSRQTSSYENRGFKRLFLHP